MTTTVVSGGNLTLAITAFNEDLPWRYRKTYRQKPSQYKKPGQIQHLSRLFVSLR